MPPLEGREDEEHGVDVDADADADAAFVVATSAVRGLR